ncbi:hypothetical protein DTO271D3_6 [Paecilomyces variotii]|nr:hypothetical protein DTO195F2_2206 [Paecilomyces variotii]KAJ9319237.1 hypothetical protein DTO271D3_6 [Paecilomyces variotii]KAJ9350415.1 hypothetical protein DTO027B9_6963 [Paecilomyces variotii]
MIGPRASLLSAALLLGKACVAVSSSTCYDQQAVSNPSFEDGLTDWTVTRGTPVVVTGDAPDGTHYLSQTAYNEGYELYLTQQLEGLDTSATYTASFTWKINLSRANVYGGVCSVGIYHDNIQSSIAQTEQPILPNTVDQWYTVTSSWIPTSSNPTLIFYGLCEYPYAIGNLELEVDNIELTTEVCCTTSSTPTPTPSSMLVSSRMPLSISSSRVSPSPSSTPIAFSSPSARTPAVSPSKSSALPLSSSSFSASSSSARKPVGTSIRSNTPSVLASSSVVSSSPVRTPARSSPSLSSTVFPAASPAIPTKGASGLPSFSSSGSPSSKPVSASGSAVKVPTGGVSRLPLSSSAVILPSPSVDPSGRNPSASGSSASSTPASILPPSRSTTGATDIQSSQPSTSPKSTTSTIFSTVTATITACPSSVQNCPARSKTTYLTTKTIAISTTICPVTETQEASVTAAPVASSRSDSTALFTTSTVYSTRTATITACPSTVTNCPARAKTTYLTTETVLVSTTVCPLTETQAASAPGLPQASSDVDTTQFITSTVLSTRTATITACPSTVTNCPASAKSTYVTTETLVAATSVQTVTEGNQPAVTGSPMGSNPSVPSAASEGSVTSTVYSSMAVTVVGCSNGQSKCSDSAKSKQISTTLVPVSTVVLPAPGISETTSPISIATAPIKPATQTPGFSSLPTIASNSSSNGSFISFAPTRTATFGSASGLHTSTSLPVPLETSASGPSAPVFTGAASRDTWNLTSLVLFMVCVILMAI